MRSSGGPFSTNCVLPHPNALSLTTPPQLLCPQTLKGNPLLKTLPTLPPNVTDPEGIALANLGAMKFESAMRSEQNQHLTSLVSSTLPL